MQYNNLGKSIAIYSTSSYPSAFRLLSARPHVNMETDSPNRLKNTIKPCKKYCSLALLSPYLVWIWGRYSHRELYTHCFHSWALYTATLLSRPCICADLKVLCVSQQCCCLYSSTPGLQSVVSNMNRCVTVVSLLAPP